MSSNLSSFSSPQTPSARVVARPSQLAWVAGSAVLLLAVIGLRLLLDDHAFPGDVWAAQVGAAQKPWLVWELTRVYQQVGRPLVAIGEVLVMFAWLWRIAGRRAAQGLVIVLMASATCGLIKIICGPTPLWTALSHVGTNFPSGVVTFMTASIGYVAVVAWRQGRRPLSLLLLLAILGSGPARVIGGQHLPSDVLGGYLLGVSWLLLAYRYLVGGPRNSPHRGPARSPVAWRTRANDLVTDAEAA